MKSLKIKSDYHYQLEVPQPVARNPDPVPALLDRASRLLQQQFATLPALPDPVAVPAALEAVLDEAARRLGDNYPYFHPLYAGQMLAPPHPVARAAYALAMAINPNNHARDGGRASSVMEIEAVAEIAAMFGWNEHLGHLTSGGTFANLEALWVAGLCAPGRRILASEQAHYTHRRISRVLLLTVHIRLRVVGCLLRPLRFGSSLVGISLGLLRGGLGLPGGLVRFLSLSRRGLVQRGEPRPGCRRLSGLR